MSFDAPRGTERVVRRLTEILQAPPTEAPRIEPLTPAAAPARAIAVDGSSVVLAESGDRMLAAYRAGHVGVERGRAITPRVPPPEVVLLDKKDATSALFERIGARDFPATTTERLDARAGIDALRSLAELEAANDALDGLARGDLLLLDGALRPHPLAPHLDRILARAAEAGVDVVGVCKSTSLSIGGAPALVACQLAARGHATWSAPLPTPANVRGRSYAARLSSAEPRAFRFDIASTEEPRAVLGRLAGLCGHPAYPGYPSPLAMAHNAVLLNEDARVRMRALVQEAVLKAGVDADAWDATFVDYHDILELGA